MMIVDVAAMLNNDGAWTLHNTLVLRNVNAPGCAAAGTVIPAGAAVTAPGDVISHCDEQAWFVDRSGVALQFGWPMHNGDLCQDATRPPNP
jgi:hypothetical protein